MAFKNKDREKAYKHEWYVQNKEHCLQRSRIYAEEHSSLIQEIAERWKSNHPGELSKAQRKSHLKRTYNLSLEDYNKLYIAQSGKCAICDQFEEKLDVDHDHTTNEIRGLLCRQCNVALGMIQENMSILSNMAMYVLKAKIGLQSYDAMSESYESQSKNIKEE